MYLPLGTGQHNIIRHQHIVIFDKFIGKYIIRHIAEKLSTFLEFIFLMDQFKLC